jgi:hypothetical protein
MRTAPPIPRSTFPRGRVLRRGVLGAQTVLASSWGVLAVGLGFAVVGAFFVLPTKNTWADRAINGLLVAAITIGALLLLSLVWQCVRYQRSLGRAEWQATAILGGNGVKFMLQRHPDAMPAHLESVAMDCWLRIPQGEVVPLAVEQFGGDSVWAFVAGEPPQTYGAYEIRWSSSRSRRTATENRTPGRRASRTRGRARCRRHSGGGERVVAHRTGKRAHSRTPTRLGSAPGVCTGERWLHTLAMPRPAHRRLHRSDRPRAGRDRAGRRQECLAAPSPEATAERSPVRRTRTEQRQHPAEAT